MKVTPKQITILNKLNSPDLNTGHHPKDAFDRRSLQSLINKGLVEEYRFVRFLHGAVRITESGKAFLGEE